MAVVDDPPGPPAGLDPRHVCLLEEWRQARGAAEIALEFEEIAGGTMAWAGPGSTWANQASGLGLRGPVSGAELDRFVAYDRDRGAPPTIEVAPYAHASLVHGLRARGLGLREFELVLATEVIPGEDCRRRIAVPLDAGIEVRRHEPGDDAADEAFARVSLSGIVPEGTEPGDEDLETSIRCLRHPRTINVGAWAGDRLVAAGAMELMLDAPDEAGRPTPVACFLAVTVRPEFRRRGIQQALMAARLQACADAGCRIACIHSDPAVATARNARRLGFTLAYTTVTVVADA